nr:schizorhodopsin [Candidatus Heimdallarchaeota archaeon]
MEEIIFYIGAGIFTVTTISFFFLRKRNQKIASINMIVNALTIASYLLMVSGLFTQQATNGEFIYWTRWAFYAFSCSFLMYEISMILSIDNKTLLEIIVFNVLVMVAGLFASITDGLIKWLFFALSSLAYLAVLYLLSKQRSENKLLFWFVVIFWSGFPVFWLLSPAGFLVLNAFWIALLYLILDLLTKVFFGYYTSLIIKKEATEA